MIDNENRFVKMAYDICVLQSFSDFGTNVKFPRVGRLLIFKGNHRTVVCVYPAKNRKIFLEQFEFENFLFISPINSSVRTTSNFLLYLITVPSKWNNLILAQLWEIHVGYFVIGCVLAVWKV